MPEQPFLSIVTPTLGKFSDYWLEHLLDIRGDDLEFVLVYYPNLPSQPIDDPRVKTLASPYQGAMMQRFTGFMNATGKYILALDDDDFVHPDILDFTRRYFQKFPESWVLRLKIAKIDKNDREKMQAEWHPLPDLDTLNIADRSTSETRRTTLQNVPIAPLYNRFDLRLLIPFTDRRDDRGPHIENFNNKIWNNAMLQQILPEISQATKVIGGSAAGHLAVIPLRAFDRLAGLFFQAYFYQEGKAIGHWMPDPEQIRFASMDPKSKPPRFHILADFILLKRFPQYGYFWNLFVAKFYGAFRAYGKLIKWKLQKKKI
ncbi:MAG: glycosyltransferase family A protein [Cyanobacteria bacterium P01_E01_bin.42]